MGNSNLPLVLVTENYFSKAAHFYESGYKRVIYPFLTEMVRATVEITFQLLVQSLFLFPGVGRLIQIV